VYISLHNNSGLSRKSKRRFQIKSSGRFQEQDIKGLFEEMNQQFSQIMACVQAYA
jgi:hypothetical protein